MFTKHEFMKLRDNKLSSGYTLLELLMTLFVIGATSAVVIPAVGKLIADMEARAFVLQLEADIAFAQKYAIAKERPVRFNLNGFSGSGLYRISEQNTRKTIKVVHFPEGVSARQIIELTFQPNQSFAGQSNGGTVTVKRGSEPFAKVAISLLSNRTRVIWQ